MAEYDPERITYFAKADARGNNVSFGIKAKDRTRHVYVIGKTGMGKSTLLENMAVQDIANGEGMAFIDPHGQTAETLLDYIPEHRKKDVLYFAPFDTENPVAFNVMEDVGADKRHLVVSGLMSVFKKIFVDAWSARMEYILTNTLLALLEYPDATLLGVNRMLSDKVYRRKVIDNITDPSVKAFWVDEFLKYNERYMQEAGDSIKNKIGQFTANPLIRNIIGQPKSSFDIREMMDNKKIIIMNLSKGLIGETNANLLGSMLITRIYLSAMSRAELSPGAMAEMSNFYFYVDEFQSFANEAFANILSEARKYKLNLTIAHQYIEQMEEEVKNAVFGNVGTTITFRVGPFDAEVLETIYQPQFYAVDICNLGFAQIYLTLMIDGVGSQPFSAVTLPPIEQTDISCKDMIIHESRKQYTHAREGVETAINDWHGINAPSTNDSKKDGGNRATSQGKGNTFKKNNNDRRERAPLTTSVQRVVPHATKEVKSHYVKSERSAKSSGSYQKRENESQSMKDTKPRSDYKTHAPIEKPQQPSQKKEKNLEELRSILGTLSKGDDKNAPSKKKETQSSGDSVVQKKEQMHTADTKKADLKEALSGITEKHIPSKKNQTVLPVTTDSVTQNSPVAIEKNKTVPVTGSKSKIQTRQQFTPHSVQKKENAPARSPKNNLDPKELERMMRVNTSDRTPLK